MITDLEDDILFVPPEERRAVCAEGARPMADDGMAYAVIGGDDYRNNCIKED